MGLSNAERDEQLRILRRHPDEHLVLPAGRYTKDVRVLVEVDGLRVSLHRWLYRETVGPLGDREFLLPDCGTEGCQTPTHRFLSPSPHRLGPSSAAPRILLGTPRAWEINAAKTHCPQGHEYSPQNNYIWVDKKGRRHRKCRRCTIFRAMEQSQRETEEKRARS
jgi:hypothetical protein